MATVQYEIETLNNDDNRLNEIPIKVMIRNDGLHKIKLISIIPNLSDDIELEEKVDTFQAEKKTQSIVLCQELTFIVESATFATNEEYRKKLMAALKSFYSDFMKELPNLYWRLFFKSTLFKAKIDSYNAQLNQGIFKITNAEDAELAFKKWIIKLEPSDPQRITYEAKSAQLDRLTKDMGKAGTDYIAYIEPASFYSRTYVLSFYRNALSTKVYNVSFDSKYEDEDTKQELRANVSTSINISPKPLFLNLFVVVSSLLGTVLKYCMTNIDTANKPERFFSDLGNTLIHEKGMIAVIVGVLFFNLYEFTDIGKKIKISVSWRVALTIGILAGILGDRLIEAVKVFIGLT